MRIAFFGATSKTGRRVVPALCARGHDVLAIGRDAGRLAGLGGTPRRLVADIERPETIGEVLRDVEVVASLAHARHIPALLAAAPPIGQRWVLTGSVRIFTRLPDPAADAVRAGMAAFASSGCRGVVLLPSMIYGAEQERNVSRLRALFRRLPRALPVPIPLPDGGRHHVQPVFVDDMVAAVVAAIERPEADGPPIVVAGPEPMTYAAMVETVAAAVGRRVLVVPLPLGVLVAAAAWLERLGVPLPFSAAELRRAGEDKAFDVGPLAARLGVRPRDYATGIRAHARLVPR